MESVFLTCIFGLLISCTEGSPNLTVPIAGNCGEDTVLVCHVTDIIGYTHWYGLNRYLLYDGRVYRSEDNTKYTETRGVGAFNLTINNTDITDEGEYRCRNDYSWSENVYLKIECRATEAVATVDSRKKLTIIADKVYPWSPSYRVSFIKENSNVTIPGNARCLNSIQYPGYCQFIWSSYYSLADGAYTYSIVVTTITRSDALTGSFRIVSPQTPVISDTVILNDGRVVVYGNEGQSLTIQCTSTGGYPAPTIVIYNDSVTSSNQLASKSSGILQTDETYNVILQYTFTASLSDDNKSLICRSYYPMADSNYLGSQTESVILYLRLKPKVPTVRQLTDVTAGSTVEVRCTTTGSRPAAVITWSYQDFRYAGAVNSSFDNITETYTVVSEFRRQVTAADNGRYLQCVVTHPTLVSPSEIQASINLDVQFPVQSSSTRITGNRDMVVTGTTTLALTCTTGTSNPASDITWKNGSETIKSNRPYTESTGENNGVVRSQQLVLTPTRYMDGDVITCSVSNAVSESPVTDTVALDLRYSPFVKIQQLQVTPLTEGTREQLSCEVFSKPASTITWYKGNTQLSQDTPGNNILNYSLTPVNRTHYGIYRCAASNAIYPDNEENVLVSVRFKPLSTTITGNRDIIANGKNKLSLICTSGSSNPVSNITWRINNITTPSTSNLPDQSGQYGGTKCQTEITLMPTRDNDGDIVSCESKNYIGTSEKTETILNLKYRPMIEPMQDQVVVEGNTTVLTCKASSKPASTFIWFRQGQSGIIHQGTGTVDKNQLPYTISNTRRTHAGRYRCGANNGIEMEDVKYVLLTVYYPPDVSAYIRDTLNEAETVVLMCNVSGIPNNQYKYGKWIQKWPGTDAIVKEYSGSPSLVLHSLTYEHSGVYSCSASNGIKVSGTEKKYMEGSVQLLVKSDPIILSIDDKIPAKLTQTISIQIIFYSNVEGSDVKCLKNVNGTRKNNKTTNISIVPVEVSLPVFSYSIKTTGNRGLISMRINSKEDFGFYDVVVTNEVGTIFRTVEIFPRGPPSVPYNVTIYNIQYRQAGLSWIPGYHGGAAQTFVAEVSTDLSNWYEASTVFGGMDESEEAISAELTSLNESTLYFVRLYAYNSVGKSQFTTYLNFTTLDKVIYQNKSKLIAGATGGTASFLITAVVLVILVMRRRGMCTQGMMRTKLRDPISLINPKRKKKDGKMLEMNCLDSSLETYEGLQYESERIERCRQNPYDFLKVKSGVMKENETPVYENLKDIAIVSSAHSTKSKDAAVNDPEPIYENLILRVVTQKEV